MSFKVNDKKLLKKYNKVWDKVSDLLGVQFDSDPGYGDNEKYINNKNKDIRIASLHIFRVKRCLKKMHHKTVSHWLE